MEYTPHSSEGKNVPPVKPGERRWVQCSNYRTMAVWGTDGKWRAYYDGKEVTGITKVFDE